MAANIAEAWRERRYEAAVVSKLDDAESEGAELARMFIGLGRVGRAGAAALVTGSNRLSGAAACVATTTEWRLSDRVPGLVLAAAIFPPLSAN